MSDSKISLLMEINNKQNRKCTHTHTQACMCTHAHTHALESILTWLCTFHFSLLNTAHSSKSNLVGLVQFLKLQKHNPTKHSQNLSKTLFTTTMKTQKNSLPVALSPLDVLRGDAQSVLGPHITDGVVALVSRALVWVLRSRLSVVVWQSSEGLNGVAATRRKSLTPSLPSCKGSGLKSVCTPLRQYIGMAATRRKSLTPSLPSCKGSRLKSVRTPL